MARGGHAKLVLPPPPFWGPFPRLRRARGRSRDNMRVHGIIPAFAGSTQTMSTPRHRSRDHPRVRGEHSTQVQEAALEQGSSPRSRGAQPHIVGIPDLVVIITAFAGSTLRTTTSRAVSRNHPRVRGEHLAAALLAYELWGSSPRSRGALFALVFQVVAVGIIPAFAGSTFTSRATIREMRDHPRVRGEHTVMDDNSLLVQGSSPRSRGAPNRRVPRPTTRGIIPAFAGSTGHGTAAAAGTWDHPRVRGEH